MSKVEIPCIIIVSFSRIESDSRVLRQIHSLRRHFQVCSVGYGEFTSTGVTHFKLQETAFLDKLLAAILLFFRSYKYAYKLIFKLSPVLDLVNTYSPRLLILNDSSSWPISKYFPLVPAFMDAHEFSVDELSDSWRWRTFIRPFKIWCVDHLKYGSCFSTVEPNLARLWSNYSGKTFSVIRSTSSYLPPPCAHGNNSQSISFVHHGVAHPSRKLENMLNAFSSVSADFSLSLYLVPGSSRYIKSLHSVASAFSNVNINPPVPHAQLLLTLQHYDAAIISIYPSNVNYKFCLPNKLFQCIQARLPLVVGPTPSIASIVEAYDIGIVANGFDSTSLADAIRSITPNMLLRYKSNLDKAALELSWSHDESVLLRDVYRLIYNI